MGARRGSAGSSRHPAAIARTCELMLAGERQSVLRQSRWPLYLSALRTRPLLDTHSIEGDRTVSTVQVCGRTPTLCCRIRAQTFAAQRCPRRHGSGDHANDEIQIGPPTRRQHWALQPETKGPGPVNVEPNHQPGREHAPLSKTARWSVKRSIPDAEQKADKHHEHGSLYSHRLDPAICRSTCGLPRPYHHPRGW